MELIYNTLESLSYAITTPYYIILIIVIGVVLYKKNTQISLMNSMIVGEQSHTPLELTLSQFGIGIFGGIALSILLSLYGIVFNEQSGIQVLFVISIALMFIKPKFVCFSYSGAILGAMSIIIKLLGLNELYGFHFMDIDITMLMSFVAIMHIGEGLFVMIDGSTGAIPVFSDRNGKIIGGYALKRNWVVPIALFIAFSMNSQTNIGTETIPTPNWWPILNTNSSFDIFDTMLVTCIPFWSIIGYSSITFTKTKKVKGILSGLWIFAFGIILLFVSRIADFGIIGEIFVILFTPISHEAMLRIQNKLENRIEPKFVSDDEGFSVLDVVKNSKAYKLGFRSSDKILSINGNKIDSEIEIYKKIKVRLTEFIIKDSKGIESKIIVKENSKDRMGILVVPKEVDIEKTVPIEQNKFSTIFNKMKNKK